MKLTRRQLKKLIKEAAYDAVRVKTQRKEDYDPPAGLKSVSDGKPREYEQPIKRVGNFFASKLPYKPPRGFSSLGKKKYFYMILPDGEAISIDHRDLSINNPKLITAYLNLLNAKVTPLPIEDIHNPTPQDIENINTMRSQINLVIKQFKEMHNV